MYDISTTTIQDLHLAAIAHRGDYSESGIAFQKLGAILSAGGHWPDTRGMVGVYYDDPSTTKPEDLRSHAGVIWARDDLPDGLDPVTLQGGRCAVLHFKGPYSGLAAAYQYLYGPWLAENKVALRDVPSFEVYLNDPTDTAPDDLLTDIHIPLAG